MKTQKSIRGIFERPPGSGCWWISYFAQGRHHREKVGPRSAAIEAYRLRKTQARLGQFFPIGNRAKPEPTFGVIAEEALASKNGRLAPLTVRCDEIHWKVRRKSMKVTLKKTGEEFEFPRGIALALLHMPNSSVEEPVAAAPAAPDGACVTRTKRRRSVVDAE